MSFEENTERGTLEDRAVASCLWPLVKDSEEGCGPSVAVARSWSSSRGSLVFSPTGAAGAQSGLEWWHLRVKMALGTASSNPQ